MYSAWKLQYDIENRKITPPEIIICFIIFPQNIKIIIFGMYSAWK